MKLKGWKNIFSFTFAQQIKTKSFIISTIIIGVLIALMTAAANVVPAILLQNEINKLSASSGAEAEGETLSISKVYIANETDIDPDAQNALSPMGITAENIPSEQSEAKISELEGTSENAMLARITKAEEGYFSVEAFYAGANSSAKKDDCEKIANLIAFRVKAQHLISQGLPESELNTALSDVPVTTSQAGKSPVSMVQEMVNMFVPMIGSIVLFIFIFAYSQLIAQAVAIEKSSRVMEYLLTSVSPLSIIVGKVLAICLVSLMQFILLILCGAAGFLISMPFGIFSKASDIGDAIASTGINIRSVLNDIANAFSTVNIGTFIIIIVTFILGFLFFALIAGLAGASISKMEDLSAAIQPMSLIGVLGFYLAYIPQVGNVDGEPNLLQKIAWFLPFSSPFCLPSAYMLGQISLIGTLISLVLLAACVVILCMIVAKVYEHIVLYNGDRLKLSDMLKMAKSENK